MNSTYRVRSFYRRAVAYGFSACFIFNVNASYAESASEFVSIPVLIDNSASGDKPNVLFILDNSNSMDEAPSGQAVGSANAGSKSEMARNAIKDIIGTYAGAARMGLMAYQQNGISSQYLHDSQYDASFNPANYDDSYSGDRDSSTKKFRITNPADGGTYIYYNISLPFYAGGNFSTAFCYSGTADFDNGSESASIGPWDSYDCFSQKIGDNDDFNNYFGMVGRYGFVPTDSDYAQNILDFGTILTWQFVSKTWFSHSSPGRGFLHVEVGDVDTARLNSLNNALGTSQFTMATDTPLRNAGLTPIEGALGSALDYYKGTLSNTEHTGGTPAAPPVNACEPHDYVILVTDGLPSVDASGAQLTDTSAAIASAAARAADLLANGIETYVIGFGLPNGVDGSLLDNIAIAGGTSRTYLAGDSATLNNALKSIFLSLSNKDASSSSAAVLANNARGEGAVIRAAYSPSKVDSLGNEVKWVGSLSGLFIDENALLREDTNQNGQLDGYDTDRVVQYFFNTGLSKSQANLYSGAGESTPPDLAVDTPEAIVNVDQLNTIWEARDALGDIADADILTQRSYTDSAANGRYIITSIDGQQALDFVQVSDEAIEALAAVQALAAEALAFAKIDANTAQAQLDGHSGAITPLTNQRDTAQLDYASAQAAILAEDEALTAANDALAAALGSSAIDAAQIEVNLRQAELIIAQGNEENALQDLDNAEAILQGAIDILPDFEASAITVWSAYSGALTAYNLATATVNGSNDLISYLDTDSVEDAYNTVKFVRGKDGIAGYRSRAIDYDEDGDIEVWRLGDIVHSSPAVVGAPSSRYDSLYFDTTYAAFRQQYKDRRQVVYVGGNDGMVHAFNGGFWNLANKSFEVGSGAGHPLGAELWSYVPRAALPHLQWQTDPNYAHTYYVDGSPIVFDANIFPSDADHPNGWGTVLMIGMGFGGSDIGVDLDNDGTDDTTLTSSYSLFDVTNPEQPPVLLAEISHPALGYTTSLPTVVKQRVAGTDFSSPSTNEWYVAFGSGPTILEDGTSDQSASLFIYDLQTETYKSGFGPLDLGGTDTFVGDITAVDNGQNFTDDTLYYGVNGGIPGPLIIPNDQTGVLKRTRLDVAAQSSTLIDAGEPIISAPFVSVDQVGRRWVAFGTGRLLMAPDNTSIAAQAYYGVMEPVDALGDFDWSSVLLTELENTTLIEVLDTGAISRGGDVEIPSGTVVETFDQLIAAIRNNRGGWYLDLEHDGTNPSARNLSRAALFGNILLFASYKPALILDCTAGTSRLYGVDLRTGTAAPFEVFSVGDDPDTSEGDVVANHVEMGHGLYEGITVVKNGGSETLGSGASVVASGSESDIYQLNLNSDSFRTGRQSWRQINLD
ncbi:MAG: hypothetical protein ACI9Y1_002341 [Lentisphaeria bacterium]|jgi:hypothetical protein